MEVSIKAEVIDNIKVEDNVIGDKACAAESLIGVKHKLEEEPLKFSVGEIKTEDDENGSSSNKKIKSGVDYDDVKDDEELEEKKPEDDPYAYIKLGHFTCEIYKMELGNLPRFISYTCLKKLIEKNCKVKPHKIKVIKEGNKPYSFISFKSADDRDKAIGIMNGLTWKKQKLYAKRANPAKDPLIKKRLEEDLSNEPEIGLENIADAGDRLNDKICPLWRTPYDEQLKIKAENYLAFLISLRKDIVHLTESPGDTQFNTIKWANEIGEQNNGSICPIEEIKPSPVTSGYRNKCEFSIGPGKIVGFRLGLYKEGSLSVITPPENCPIVSSKIRNIVLLFQDYLQTRDFDAFNNVTHEGVWRQLTVRATDLGAMLIIAVHPQNMSKDRLEEEKKAIVDYFTKNQDKCTVTSLFFHPFVTRDKTIHDSSELQLIDGEPFILESMRNGSLTMKISPFAFFQTNTKAAEVCYQTIEELASLNESSVVLDICCGTGSIGIYLAGKVKHVIGLELNHDALKDARYNVEINKITNIEFVEGKAEDVLDSVLQRAFEKFGNDIDLTAIIDPPRPGLHPSVIKTIRSTANIKKLIYVSCEPKLARKNLIDLSRPKSNSYKGIPFVPTRAIPIDMFPHTTHCELLLLYQRMDTLDLNKCS